jgi:hypothetical protein
MPEKEIFEGISDDEEKVAVEVEEPVKKPAKKGRAPLSDERKAQLREQLKKGRETSLANRQKKALVRKADKAEKDKVDNAKIAKHILGKDLNANHADEIEKLKNELAELKKAKSAPAPAPKEPEPVKAEPKPENVKVEVPKPAPVKQSLPPAPKVFNTASARKKRMF